MSTAGKMDQITAGYTLANSDKVCGNCIHFNGQNACDIVDGHISAEMICNYHEDVPTSASNFEQFVPTENQFKMPEIAGIPDPFKLAVDASVAESGGNELRKFAAYTMVPTSALDSVKAKGLMSGKSLLSDPEALAAAAAGRNKDPEEMRKELEETLGGWKPESAEGPNVFFKAPPEGFELPEHHPSKRNDLTEIGVDIDQLLADSPETRVHGSELTPYNEEESKRLGDAYIPQRHRDLDPEDLAEIRGRSSEDLWKNMDKEFKGYAANVPHAALINESGKIDPKYLRFPEAKRATDYDSDKMLEKLRHTRGECILCGKVLGEIFEAGGNACSDCEDDAKHHITKCDCGEMIGQCRCSPKNRIKPIFIHKGGCRDCSGKEVKRAEDKLPGGLADNKTPEDFEDKPLAKGTKVELEHVDDEDLAQEISMDHLTEDGEYYAKLEKMEEKEAAWVSYCNGFYLGGRLAETLLDNSVKQASKAGVAGKLLRAFLGLGDDATRSLSAYTKIPTEHIRNRAAKTIANKMAPGGGGKGLADAAVNSQRANLALDIAEGTPMSRRDFLSQGARSGVRYVSQQVENAKDIAAAGGNVLAGQAKAVGKTIPRAGVGLLQSLAAFPPTAWKMFKGSPKSVKGLVGTVGGLGSANWLSELTGVDKDTFTNLYGTMRKGFESLYPQGSSQPTGQIVGGLPSLDKLANAEDGRCCCVGEALALLPPELRYNVECGKVLGELVKRGGTVCEVCQTKQANAVDDAAKNVDSNPTEAQKEQGNYAKGHVSVYGMRIAIENAKGGYRSGTSEDGKTWRTKMHCHYGYLKGTEGKDGDHVDVFVGPNPDSEFVVVVNQVNPKTKKFDEHKCMLGFDNEKDAVAAYLKNYEDGWQGKGEVSSLTMKQFKWWLQNADTKKEVKNGYFAARGNLKKANVEDGECCCIAPSSIHGRGAYSKQEYQPGDVIGEALVLLPPEHSSNAEEREYLRTTVGRFVNHSQTQANTALLPNGENFDLIATRSIEAGGEMLADYVDANSLLTQVDTRPYDFNYEGYASPIHGYTDETQEVNHQSHSEQSPEAKTSIISISSIKAANPFAKQAEFEKLAAEEEVEKPTYPPTVAVDLDGTLANYDGFKGEDVIGDPRPYAQKMMQRFNDDGYTIIVFTCRGKKSAVSKWLKAHDIPYDYINENPNQPPGASDKVLADAYVDDKAVPADDLEKATSQVNQMIASKKG